MKVSKKKLVISCFGKVNMKSAAKMCRTSQAFVSMTWRDAGFIYEKKNSKLSYKNYFR